MVKRTVFRWGKDKSLEQEDMVINGNKTIATRVRTLDSIGVIALLDKDRIILERQYRKGVKKWVYEIPAGHLERGENLKNAVRRELQEEVGYYPKKIKFLLRAYVNPGVETEMESIFVATDLVKSKKEMDDDEKINLKIIKISQLRKMIRKNEILDATSLAGLLHYLYLIDNKK